MSTANLNDEEWFIYRWRKGMLGSFEDSLANTLSCADEGNLAKLEKAFPVEVSAYKKYTRERGWWQSVLQKTNEQR